MSKTAERSHVTAEALEWAEVEGKHAEMHLLRRAALLAVESVVQYVGIDERASSESEQSSYLPGRRLATLLKRPHETVRDGYGVKLHATNLIALGKQDAPDDADFPYEFARIEESGDYNFEGVYSRLIFGGKLKSRKDTYYRPEFVVKHYVGPTVANPWATKEIPDSSVRMMDHPNLDVRRHEMWSPESMINHYQGQIDHLAVFIDEVADVAQAAGAYIHHSTSMRHYLEDEASA